MGLANVAYREREERLITLSNLGREQADTILLSGDNVDSDGGHTPTDEFRAGNVVVLKTATGEYVEANDATGDRASQASLTGNVSDATARAGFGKTFKWKRKGGAEKTVTLGSTSADHDDWTEIAAALNANADFATDLVAAKSGNYLNIKSRVAGADEFIEVTDGTLNAVAGFTDNTVIYGADADYRVTLHMAKLKDSDGNALGAQEVLGARFGHFNSDQLINLTGEARVVLTKRGSIFEAAGA